MKLKITTHLKTGEEFVEYIESDLEMDRDEINARVLFFTGAISAEKDGKIYIIPPENVKYVTFELAEQLCTPLNPK
jgi:predicted DNA-binding protein with PD1-like motif